MHDGRFVVRLSFCRGRQGRWSDVEVEREGEMKGKRVGNGRERSLAGKMRDRRCSCELVDGVGRSGG